jgi:hypothetical protein
MPTVAESSNQALAAKGADAPANEPIVIDLGKRRRKQVKRLREGRGKLMDDVGGVIEELRAAGAIGASAQPVVIIVRERRKNPLAWPLG